MTIAWPTLRITSVRFPLPTVYDQAVALAIFSASSCFRSLPGTFFASDPVLTRNSDAD
jgi:hypothetical protein